MLFSDFFMFLLLFKKQSDFNFSTVSFFTDQYELQKVG